MDEQELKNREAKYNHHLDICKELNDLYRQKNHDYNDSFGRGFRKHGLVSVVSRLEDKYLRIEALATDVEPRVNESKRDTLRDLANYAIMALVELDAAEGKVTGYEVP